MEFIAYSDRVSVALLKRLWRIQLSVKGLSKVHCLINRNKYQQN